MRPLLRILPLLTFSCSLVAGFEEFSAAPDAQGGRAGEGAGSARGGNESSAGSGVTLGGGAGHRNGDTGGSAGNGGSGIGAAGGSTGAAGAEGGADSGGGTEAGGPPGSSGRAGSGAGGPAQGGSSPTAGSGGISGEASCGELLVNADFDLGPTGAWREYVTYSDSLRIIVPKDDEWLAAEGVAPVGGDFLAWLGGIPDNEERSHKSRLHQTVHIPANVSRLRFRGWLWVKTREPEADAAYDHAYAQIVQVDTMPDDSSVLHLFTHWSNLDSGDDWAEFDFDTTELDAMRGRTLTLEVYSETDLDYATSFWLDSLSLHAECAR